LEDQSGPVAQSILCEWGATNVERLIVSDDIEEIRRVVVRLVRERGCRLLVTTGGTGVGPRDVTPEALGALWSKPIPGIGELLRARGAVSTSLSWLSRSAGGLIDSSLVIALPGKPSAVREGLASLREQIPHLLHIAEGGGH
jgi:molybdenum cofactor synthesis domain-containing protein